MPKSPSCTGAPAFGAPLQISISYPAIQETTGLSVELPTSEPGTAQVSYTVAAGDLPTVSPSVPFQFAPNICAQFQNLSGASRTLSWRVLVNGTSRATGSGSINNNYYGVFSSCNYNGVQPVVGDVITVAFWTATGAGLYLKAYSYESGITRILYGKQQLYLWSGYSPTQCMVCESTAAGPSFGAKNYASASYMLKYVTPTANSNANLCGTVGLTPYAYMSHITEGLFTAYYGDYYFPQVTQQANAALVPVYIQKRPLIITLLPLNIKI